MQSIAQSCGFTVHYSSLQAQDGDASQILSVHFQHDQLLLFQTGRVPGLPCVPPRAVKAACLRVNWWGNPRAPQPTANGVAGSIRLDSGQPLLAAAALP